MAQQHSQRFDATCLEPAQEDGPVARPGSTGLLVTAAFGPGLAGRGGPSHHVRIVNSSFRHNAGDGIRSLGSTNSVIKGNLLSDNRGTGIDWGGNRNRLSRNRIIRDGTGILVNGSRNVIARNRVSHSRRDGVFIESGRGNLLAPRFGCR